MQFDPTMPGIPPQPPEPPRQPERKSNKIAAGVGMAVLAALGVGIFAGTWIDEDSTPKEPSSSAGRPTLDDLPGIPDEVTDDPESDTVYVTPIASDFTIELKVKSQKCFGSAGCLVTVSPELSYDGLTSELDPDTYVEITYEISGDEDGRIVETLELTNGDDVTYNDVVVSTSSSAVEPEAEVTDVEVW